MRTKSRTAVSKPGWCAARLACGLSLLVGASDVLADAGGSSDAAARFRGSSKADPIRVVNVRRASRPVTGQSAITFDLARDRSFSPTPGSSTSRPASAPCARPRDVVLVQMRLSGRTGPSRKRIPVFFANSANWAAVLL